MITLIAILILIAVTHFNSIKFTKRSTSSVMNSKPKRTVIPEGDRTPEEIVNGRPFHIVYKELSAIKDEDITGNEMLVLWGITEWYKENAGYKP